MNVHWCSFHKERGTRRVSGRATEKREIIEVREKERREMIHMFVQVRTQVETNKKSQRKKDKKTGNERQGKETCVCWKVFSLCVCVCCLGFGVTD